MADETEAVGFLTVDLPDGGTWTHLDRLTDGRVMCCLCFTYCARDQLSRDDDGQLTDVCQSCRDHESAQALAERTTP